MGIITRESKPKQDNVQKLKTFLKNITKQKNVKHNKLG